MAYSIRAIATGDREPVMDIFNHYIEHTFAAFPENRLPYPAFDMLMEMTRGYPTGVAVDEKGAVLGYGMLRPHHPIPVFSGTAEFTCFLHPDHTGRGVGAMLLDFLELKGREKGIDTILACISSLNPRSIHFHQTHGFVECGRFVGVGKKKGRPFDTVWMQKMLA